MAKAAFRIDCGTAVSAARDAMITTGRISNASTSPPTTGADRGSPNAPRNTAAPNRPNTIDGTAARLLIFTSIRPVTRFRGANSSR